MQHLLLLYLIVSILPGVASLTVLSALAARLRNRALTYYLIAYSSFSVSILINLTMFYLGINISMEISYGVFLLISFGIPFSILMHTMLALSVNEVTQPPKKQLLDGLIITIGCVETALFFTPLLIQYSKESSSLVFGPIYPMSSIIEIASIIYSITLIIIFRKRISDLRIRRYILILICILAIFLPAIGHDQFFFFGMGSINEIPVEVILSPALYMVISILTLIFGTQSLLSTIRLERSVDPGSEESKRQALELRIQELSTSYGLSMRESSIIPLIGKGLGNKQIAYELDISAKTVGNHIYNIYKKLDISSRYELLSLLND